MGLYIQCNCVYANGVGFGVAYPRMEAIPEPDVRDEQQYRLPRSSFMFQRFNKISEKLTWCKESRHGNVVP